ncbi:MAG: hypothetical protein ACERIH_07235 [Labilibaculum antarcticum]
MDYIFYRIYSFYKKKEDIPIATGIMFIFVVQFCAILLVGVTINLYSGNIISKDHIGESQFWIVYGSVLATLLLFDIFRYVRTKTLENILQKYDGLELNKKIKTWQVFILPVLLVILTLLMVVIVKSF